MHPWGMSRRLLLSAVALGLMATGCGAHDNQPGADATPTVALSITGTTAASGTTLWPKDSFPVAIPDRWVVLDGDVGVTKSGCFTIGDAVLWANQGSHIVANGAAIHLTGLGTFRIGDHIDAAGSFYRTKAASNLAPVPRKCADGQRYMSVASLYSPHTMRALPPCLNENDPPFC